MKSTISRLVYFFALIMLSFESPAIDVWFEPNVARDVVTPNIFKQSFQQPQSFEQAAHHIKVYMVLASLLRKLDDEFLVGVFLPYLQQRHIKLAVDAPFVHFASLPAHAAERDEQIKLYRRLKALGFTVDYIVLESVLSKGKPRIPWTHDSVPGRIEDAVSYAKQVREIFPDTQFGIIDALATQAFPYKDAYTSLKQAMNHEALKFTFIHLDMPFNRVQRGLRGVSWETVREVEHFVEDELGLQFGLLATSTRAARISNQAFHDETIASMECYLMAGGTPSEFIITSWYTYPDRIISDTSSVNDYPAMSTVSDFGTILESYERTHTLERSSSKLPCRTEKALRARPLN